MKKSILVLFLACVFSLRAMEDPFLLVISIDGMPPKHIFESDELQINVPYIKQFIEEGIYALGVQGVTPTLTLPSHATMMIGVLPEVHGSIGNNRFDPFHELNYLDGQYYSVYEIRAPTLWEIAREHQNVVANVGWPLTTDLEIPYNIPDYSAKPKDFGREIMKAAYSHTYKHLGPLLEGYQPHLFLEDDRRRAQIASHLIWSRPDLHFMTLTWPRLIRHLITMDPMPRRV